MALAQESSKMRLMDLPPNGSRRVTVRHVGRKLAGSMIVDTKAGPSQVIRLAPWGGVRGRIVKPDGTPWGKVNLVAGTPFGKIPRREPFDTLPQGADVGSHLTDPEGRFEIVGLVPRVNYSASAGDGERPLIGGLFEDLTVLPGEVKDLGDLKVRPFPPRSPATR